MAILQQKATADWGGSFDPALTQIKATGRRFGSNRPMTESRLAPEAPRLEVSPLSKAEAPAAFALARSTNSEVAFRFYRAAINGGYKDVRAPLEAFLMSVGRQKFVVPLYAALRKNEDDRTWAQAVYQRARPRYHPETQASVDKEMAVK